MTDRLRITESGADKINSKKRKGGGTLHKGVVTERASHHMWVEFDYFPTWRNSMNAIRKKSGPEHSRPPKRDYENARHTGTAQFSDRGYE